MFFWMMPTGSEFWRLTQDAVRVSILVLLDDAYRRSPSTWKGFFIAVSILVLLDDAYRPDIDQEKAFAALWFQSLFFWMMPTGTE